jgi:hypothetical protein
MLLEFTELFLCALFTRKVSKFEKEYQMVIELAVFENILDQLGDKQTFSFSTISKQHKISFFVDLLAILKY